MRARYLPRRDFRSPSGRRLQALRVHAPLVPQSEWGDHPVTYDLTGVRNVSNRPSSCRSLAGSSETGYLPSSLQCSLATLTGTVQIPVTGCREADLRDQHPVRAINNSP